MNRQFIFFKKNKMEVIITILGVLALIPIIICYSVFSKSFVCYKFYYWFILPLFPELIELSLIQVVGVIFLITSISNKHYCNIKKEYKDDSNMWVSLVSPYPKDSRGLK